MKLRARYPMQTPEQWLERLEGSYIPEPNSGCWLWVAACYRHNYGNVNIGRRSVSAHRLSYELHRGPIPPGMVLDHLCRTPRCINPAHLEPVTQKVNIRRGNYMAGPLARGRQMRMATICRRGHPYTDDTVVVAGSRRCITCIRVQWTKTNIRRRAERLANRV